WGGTGRGWARRPRSRPAVRHRPRASPPTPRTPNAPPSPRTPTRWPRATRRSSRDSRRAAPARCARRRAGTSISRSASRATCSSGCSGLRPEGRARGSRESWARRRSAWRSGRWSMRAGRWGRPAGRRTSCSWASRPTWGGCSDPAPAVTVPRELARVLTLRDLVLIVVGTTIGSGIFTVPGAVLRQSGGDLGVALVVWVVGSVLALLGALTFGELGAMLPDAGG